MKAAAESCAGQPVGSGRERELVDAHAEDGGVGEVAECREVGVDDAPSAADYGFGVDLVGEPEARSDGVRVVFGELAVATAGAVTFVDLAAEQTARGGVGDGRTEHAVALVEFVAFVLLIPADTVVEREPVVHFPAVLDVEAPAVAAPLGVLRGVDGCIVDCAEQEAGVGDADAAAAKALAVGGRVAALDGAEVQHALGLPGVAVGPAFLAKVATDFIRVVAANVGEAGWVRGLRVVVQVGVRRADRRAQAACRGREQAVEAGKAAAGGCGGTADEADPRDRVVIQHARGGTVGIVPAE